MSHKTAATDRRNGRLEGSPATGICELQQVFGTDPSGQTSVQCQDIAPSARSEIELPTREALGAYDFRA
jgi:hypothetical protein